MSKRKEGQARGKYTLEFRLEAVRLDKGAQAVPVAAKILGTLGNRVRLNNKDQLKGVGDKPASPYQIELARLRAENARLRVERDMLGKATVYFAKGSLCSTRGLASIRPCGLSP